MNEKQLSAHTVAGQRRSHTGFLSRSGESAAPGQHKAPSRSAQAATVPRAPDLWQLPAAATCGGYLGPAWPKDKLRSVPAGKRYRLDHQQPTSAVGPALGVQGVQVAENRQRA